MLKQRFLAIILIFLLFTILGFFSYIEIPKERNPDIQLPMIYVKLSYEGISSQDAEKVLVRPVEAELKTIEAIKKIRSYAEENNASMVVELKAGSKIDAAIEDIRASVSNAKLPNDMDREPLIKEINLGEPVLTIVLSGEVPERTLVSYAYELERQLKRISEVLSVDKVGIREEIVEIIISPENIEKLSLSSMNIFSILQQNHNLIAVGKYQDGSSSYSINIDGLLSNIQELQSLPIKVSDKIVITLGEIATIRPSFKDLTNTARVNELPAISLEVKKRSGANIIDTVNKIRKVAEEMEKILPSKIKILYLNDDSERIRSILTDLENNIILAIILVLIITIGIIGLRNSSLIALSIPSTFLISIFFFDIFDISLNIVILFSLILSVGLIVDSAIVVCEFAKRRYDSYNETISNAYIQSISRMSKPILLSNITTIMAFAPLLFWPGIVGQFMQYMPITIIITISVSLLISLLVVPAIAIAFFGSKQKKKIENKEENIQENANSIYGHILRTILRVPKTFIILTLIGIGTIFWLYGKTSVGTKFFPDIEPDNAYIEIRSPGNLSVYKKEEISRQVEKIALDMLSEIPIIYAKSGNVSDSSKKNLISVIYLEFANWKKRRPAKEIMEELRTRIGNIPNTNISVVQQQKGPQSSNPIELNILSNNFEDIEKATYFIQEILEKNEKVIDIRSNLSKAEFEWNIEVNRENAARFDANIAMIGNMLKMMTTGFRIGEYYSDSNAIHVNTNEEIDFMLKFPKESRNLDVIENLTIITPKGRIPLSHFVTKVPRHKSAMIEKINESFSSTVTAGIVPDALANNVIQNLEKKFVEIANDSRLDNVTIEFGGDNEDQKETGTFLMNAFLIVFVSIFILLVFEFNSLRYGFIIMSAIFLSIAGVLLGLMITQEPFVIVMCGVGVTALSGIVINNNIIYIHSFLEEKNNGHSISDALVIAGSKRVRPILLTVITTVLGLLPMIFGMNINFLVPEITFGAPSGQWWVHLSTTIAGGLTFATFLTLFFTPCAILALFGKDSK